MKKLLLILFAASTTVAAFGQDPFASVEVIAVHTGMVGTTNLAGYTTYRVYVNFDQSTDFLSTVGGTSVLPMAVNFAGDVYQNAFAGGPFADDINPAFFAFIPELQYDSWMTIGITDNVTPANQFLGSVTDPAQNFITAFEAGDSFGINSSIGGGWFTIITSVNGTAGPDMKVEVLQITTNDAFNGTLAITYFDDGVQANLTEITVPFSSVAGAVFGCMDAEATNYNPDATVDDLSCEYPCALEIQITATNPTCNGDNNGSVVAEFTGAIGQPLFAWDGGNFTINSTESGLMPGTYDYEAMDSQGCTASGQVTITNPQIITGSLSVTNVGCFNESNGVLTANFNGGSGGNMYGLIAGNYTQSTNVFSDLSPGNYTVFVQDMNGCTGQTAAIALLSANQIGINPITAQNQTCIGVNDGSLIGSASGGAGGFTYSLNGIDYQVTGSFTGLSSGDYVLYAKDANGCVQMSFSVTVGVSNSFGVFASSIQQVSCAEGSNGIVQAFPTGVPTGVVMFGLESGIFTNDNGEFSGLAAGEYTVYATDEIGCTAMSSVATVSEPTALDLILSGTNPLCNGGQDGTVSSTPSGGTEPYGFVFNFGAETLPEGEFSALEASTYTVQVIDANGCAYLSDITLTEPDAVEVELTSLDIICNGDANGEIEAGGTGGTGTFTYSIDGGIAFGSGSFADLGTGPYTIIAMDANGCVAEATTSIAEPEVLVLTGTATEDSGAGDGSIDITIGGGTMPYTYTWSNGETTQDIDELTGGDFTVTVTDANGCDIEDSFLVSVGISELLSGLDIKLFPNPSNGLFNLNIVGLNGQKVFYQLNDMTGRNLIGEESIEGFGNMTISLDLTAFSDGVYMLNLNIGGVDSTLRLVKN